MGEMADWINAQPDTPDDWAHPEPGDYLDMTDAELKAETSRARSDKVKGIRNVKGNLSDKQRYCLAAWLADHP